MTITFSITYEIPVSPERLAQLEDEIACVADSEDAEYRLARLANQMLPEKRTEPAVMRSHHDGKWAAWDCPRCARDGLTYSIAVLSDGVISVPVPSCPNCGADIHKEEFPMSLDLYRMRTRRTDGVEVQSNPKS